MDEFVPGNPLKDFARTTNGIYMSFRQFGLRLGDPNVWLCVRVLRSDIINTINGGVGNCLRHYVHTLFGQKFNLATAGIVIDGVARTY